MRRLCWVLLLVGSGALVAPAAQSRNTAPSGAVVSGELRRWHKVTLTLDGPESAETASPESMITNRKVRAAYY